MEHDSLSLYLQERSQKTNAKRWHSSYKSSYSPTFGHSFNADKVSAENVVEGLREELHERFTSIREAFLSADKNRSGYISGEEFRSLCETCNLPMFVVDEALKLVDPSGSGKISYAEFVR